MTVTHAIFDVDDVVLDMDESSTLAEASVVEPLTGYLGSEKAEAVTEAFRGAYDLLRDKLRAAESDAIEGYDSLLSRLRYHQRGVLEDGFELKLFSRESLMAYALEACGVEPTGALLHAAVDRYWKVLKDATRVYPDAHAAITTLRARGARVHLATNSDGFLRFDEDRGCLVYDPDHSRARKWDRMVAVGSMKIRLDDVTIGDPIGKPRAEFYSSVLERFERTAGPIPLETTLAVGDSLTSDILPLMKLGVARGAWIIRKKEQQPSLDAVPPGVDLISTLEELL